jgi:hypothetical protein
VCKEQGFCITVDDGRNLYGAFRVEDHEVRFKVTKQPRQFSHLFLGGDGMTGCIMSDTGHGYVDVMGCEAQDEAYSTNRQRTDLATYIDIAKHFEAYLHSTPAPENCEQHWHALQEFVHQLAQKSAQKSPPSPEQQAHPNYRDSAEALRDAEAEIAAYKAAEAQRKRDAEIARQSELDELLLLEEWTRDSSDYAESSQALGVIGHAMNLQAKRARVFGDPDMEYRQTVEIWSQKADTIPALDITRTNSDHTAVFVVVEKRVLGSNADWEFEADFFSRNHGARPGQDRMEKVRYCPPESFPVTRGYYILGGECGGGWATTHTCNDDTAYQIRSAHGVWTTLDKHGEGTCRGRRRWNAPDCTLPW